MIVDIWHISQVWADIITVSYIFQVGKFKKLPLKSDKYLVIVINCKCKVSDKTINKYMRYKKQVV